MTELELNQYIEKLQTLGSVPGLTNMENLCKCLGHPEEKLKFIHVAGTNGKGSCCAFFSHVLQAAGYKVGTYTSPAVLDYREKIQVNHKYISKRALAQYMESVKEVCEKLVSEGEIHPTLFEVETMIAFLYFVEQKCDIVILEAGFGGELDATNIIPPPLLAVITSISLDHVGILGNTISEIAHNKSGIIKKGSRVVIQHNCREVTEVLLRKCAERDITPRVVDPNKLREGKKNLKGQTFQVEGENYKISMAGRYEIMNAHLVLCGIRELQEAGFSISTESISEGLSHAIWPCRFELLSTKPLIIADGAHNPEGAMALVQSIEEYLTDYKKVFVVGTYRDKDQEEILKATAPLADQMITISTHGSRGCSAYDLANVASRYNPCVTAIDGLKEALEIATLMALGKDRVAIVVFGSLSFMKELVEIIRRYSKDEDWKERI